MKRAMISQPMGGLSDDEIRTRRDKAAQVLSERGFAVVSTLFPDSYTKRIPEGSNRPLFLLASSLVAMSQCCVVYFLDGWQNARGCRIEHDAAEVYGLELLYENSGEE